MRVLPYCVLNLIWIPTPLSSGSGGASEQARWDGICAAVPGASQWDIAMISQV